MMQRKEYDMIEGYLDGTLDEASARELEAMATDDPELALELDAERSIRTTLARDVASIPTISNEPSSLLIARLAATSGASGGAVGTSGGVLGTIFGTGTGLGVVTIVGLIGLTVGAIFFAENVEDFEPPASPTGQVSTSGLTTPDFDWTDEPQSAPTQGSAVTPPSTPSPARIVRDETNEAKTTIIEETSNQQIDPVKPDPPLPTPEEHAEQMLLRLNVEETPDTPIPHVEGPTSTMEVRVEN
jgi:hypothetical protein